MRLGCPFIDYGPFSKLAKLSRKYGKIFKSYAFGYPIVSVSGVDNVKSLLKNEFQTDAKGIGTFMLGKHNIGSIFGEDMLLYENDAEKHGVLRRLVGSAMTPAAIGAAIPSIQDAARLQIDEMLKTKSPIKMEDVFQSYTLDIAWKQILGLDLKEEDVPNFHTAVKDWTAGLMSPLLLMPIKIPGLMRFTKVGRARKYLGTKIEEKIDKLERDGPDSSTLSKLYFATDDDGSTKLTRDQVIHNALLLIFAGTETSASTLTCASLFLALHPDVWERVRAEQNDIRSRYGDDFNQEVLNESVYLDAVIKETLRLQPPEMGELRAVKNTVVVDGNQVPKGWCVLFNVKQTHYNDPSTYEEDGSHMDHRKGFRPERWMSESTKPMEWMPFGEGRRRCIGERLAMTEMKIFLAIFARKVAKYELVNNIDQSLAVQWQTDTTLARPAGGVECTLVSA
ncbi:hypothetical protein HJC23_009530 [Cyclotella cryptica]|uniref:Cytochrome P450 n=1 Tax=Cyclotella cryptica TaxID=29204 RepID=A0ABD3Q4U8_9STRA